VAQARSRLSCRHICRACHANLPACQLSASCLPASGCLPACFLLPACLLPVACLLLSSCCFLPASCCIYLRWLRFEGSQTQKETSSVKQHTCALSKEATNASGFCSWSTRKRNIDTHIQRAGQLRIPSSGAPCPVNFLPSHLTPPMITPAGV